MSEERYIAAIEISSSKIVAAVGKTTGEGPLEVIAIEEEPGVDIVRYGIIQNLEETSVKVAKVINRLQQRKGVAPLQIKSLLVGLSGRSMRNIPVDVSLPLAEDTEISDEVLTRLRNDARRTPVDPSLVVVDVVPRIYRIGKTETLSPKGMVGNHISATFDLIVCRQELQRNLQRTIQEKLGIRVAGYVVTALASGHLILTDEEKRLGCMFVDMGAETTTVSIYAKGCFRYFATLPLGGRNITRDVMSLSLLEEDAEQIKRTSGNAMPSDTAPTLNINGVRLSDVSNLIVARSEEIVANIVEQLEYASLKTTEYPSKIVYVGGGARLKNMPELLATQSNLPLTRGSLPRYVFIDDKDLSIQDVEQVVSVLYTGVRRTDCQCLEEPRREELPVNDVPSNQESPGNVPETPAEPAEPAPRPRKRGWMSGFKDRLANIFGGPEDNSDLLDE